MADTKISAIAAFTGAAPLPLAALTGLIDPAEVGGVNVSATTAGIIQPCLQVIYAARGVNLQATGDTALTKVGTWTTAAQGYNQATAGLLGVMVAKTLTGTQTVGPTVGYFSGAGATGTTYGAAASLTAVTTTGTYRPLVGLNPSGWAPTIGSTMFCNVSVAPTGSTVFTVDIFILGIILD
jgi:hypothetical protein